ncbi:MAG: diguanylate cyclase [Saccharospirillaceae bacterium]|nr:diguanylate cyclase [Saccharospirillaceae bacterium]MCD8532652.1 diguanylate cyclase [Saccharospirillaceae bacterium]
MSLYFRLFILTLLLFSGTLAAARYNSDEPAATAPLMAQYYQSADFISLPQLQAITDDQWQDVPAASINFGFTNHHVWIRMPLAQLPFDYRHDPWILELGYPLLDHAELYLLNGSTILLRTAAGNDLPYTARPIAVPELAFPVPPLSQADWLYLHVHSDSSVQIPMRALPEQEYWQQRVASVTFDAAFYAILFSMLAYNLLIFLLTRDVIFLLYSLSIAAFATMMAGLHGWTYALLWPESPHLNDLTILLSLALSEIFLALFGLFFLRLRRLHPRAFRLYSGYVVSAVALVLLSVYLPYHTMIQLLTGQAILMSISALILGLLLWWQTRSRDVFLFFLAAFSLIFGLLLYALQKFGVVPVNLITEHAAEIGSVIQVVLLALSMADRHNRERQARLAAQDVIINMQREANAVLDQKVRERTEDLEQLNQRLQEESTTDALTRVRNRRYFDQRFYTLYQDAFRQQTSLALLLIDIDHFKQFNDTYGHQLGDTVLQKVAKCMQQAIKRPQDSVYRYGGEEFAILLPNTDAQGALQVAEQLRARIDRLRITHQHQQLSVTASIGLCAAVPLGREQQELLYQQADKALYQAKTQGRNRSCALPLQQPDADDRQQNG